MSQNHNNDKRNIFIAEFTHKSKIRLTLDSNFRTDYCDFRSDYCIILNNVSEVLFKGN